MDDTKFGMALGVWLAIVAFHISLFGYGDWVSGVSAMVLLGVLLPILYGLQAYSRSRASDREDSA